MRTTCRLILGIAIFVAAAGVASAQQPDPQPTLPPLPETQVTPVPPPPDSVPPTEQTWETPVPPPIPTAPDLVVTAAAKPVKKASSPPKPRKKPALPESSSEAKEAAAAASVAAADSSSPPPPGAADVPATASPDLSPKAPAAVDPVVQAEMDKKLFDDAQRKKGAGGWIIIGLGGLALIGLAVYFVRSRGGMKTVPPIFDGGPPVQATLSVAAVRSRPAR